MLVRLQVKNFKNIRDAEIRFGPVSCLIGHNGVGKSNLFDAIKFLSLLAENSIHEAADGVRGSKDAAYSPLDLVYNRDKSAVIQLAADMVVPSVVVDDFGQSVSPSITLLSYKVSLSYSSEYDRLVLIEEHLEGVKIGDFSKFVGFKCSPEFKSSVATGARRGGPLISTDDERIRLHGDGGSRGRPAPVGKSPLTVVGGTNTSDYPTVLAAKREMASWKLLHLEPSAMRMPDQRSASPHVTSNGGRIASTFHSLVSGNSNLKFEIIGRLRKLNSDIVDLDVHSDAARDQLALRAKVPGVDNWLYARSLSEGTLRYIALVFMLVDVNERAVLCLEEPENGIHPSRIPSVVQLLHDYAVDPGFEVNSENPLRQVIINTHSPEVARRMNVDDLVFVDRVSSNESGSYCLFRPIQGTWRASYENQGVLPKNKRAFVDFIGGSPVSDDTIQLELRFGTAT